LFVFGKIRMCPVDGGEEASRETSTSSSPTEATDASRYGDQTRELSPEPAPERAEAGLASPFKQITKRGFDLVVVCFLIGPLLPICALVCLLIKLDGGPILVREERVGRRGRTFKSLKFRTIAPGQGKSPAGAVAPPVDAQEGRRQAGDPNTPRDTGFGSLLRLTGIDELPQLWNVVRGDMSLVGPRPLMPQEFQHFPPGERQSYLMALPGLTGLWEISADRATSAEQRAQLDGWYVRNWSLWRDVVILLRAWPAVVGVAKQRAPSELARSAVSPAQQAQRRPTEIP
jgi:lipopolysaccharide/colanic/teichoic acid biosynthesis glycosyltransferase